VVGRHLVPALLLFTVTGCLVPLPWPAAIPVAIVGTALATAAVISATQPPPPRVVYVVPQEHPGYAWQPGYWTRQNDQWVWIEGRWIAVPPGYTWAPTHWEQASDGSWHLVAGSTVPVAPP
jgi:hypothetical protein